MVSPLVLEIIHSLKLVDYLSVHADKPWHSYNIIRALMYMYKFNSKCANLFRRLECRQEATQTSTYNNTRIYHECEVGLEKNRPEDHRLTSRGLPSDEKR